MTNIVPQKPRKRTAFRDALAKQTPGYVEQAPAVEASTGFNLVIAQQLIDSDDEFPVNFEDAWQWLGYSRKDKALDTLKSYFEFGLDFSTMRGKSPTGGRPSDSYSLTVSCLKEFGMIAKTAQGKLIRKYFIECERIAKEAIAKPQPQQKEPQQPKIGSSIEATIAAINPLRMLLTTVPDTLVEGFLLNQLQARHPELKPEIDAAHSLLAATNPIPQILLTPTAIGQRLGISARVVNAILIANGYQTKNPSKGKTEPAYLPTEKGKEFSSNTIATGRGNDNTSYQHTKWQESIVEIVSSLM